jgi:hypothetical protein
MRGDLFVKLSQGNLQRDREHECSRDQRCNDGKPRTPVWAAILHPHQWIPAMPRGSRTRSPNAATRSNGCVGRFDVRRCLGRSGCVGLFPGDVGGRVRAAARPTAVPNRCTPPCHLASKVVAASRVIRSDGSPAQPDSDSSGLNTDWRISSVSGSSEQLLSVARTSAGPDPRRRRIRSALGGGRCPSHGAVGLGGRARSAPGAASHAARSDGWRELSNAV